MQTAECLEVYDVDKLCHLKCIPREHVLDALENFAPLGNEEIERERRGLKQVIETQRGDPHSLYRLMEDARSKRVQDFDIELRRIPLRYLALNFQKKPAVAAS